MDAYAVAWGLDIGHSAIKAVKLARSADSVTVLGYVIEPIAQEGERGEVLVAALKHLAAREEFGATPVYVALSGKQVLSRTVNVPVLNAKDIGRIVELEARQQIPGDFASVEWGYHLSPGTDGGSYDVALFAVKKDIVQELIAHTKAAGLNLVGLAPASLALYNFVRYDQEFPGDETVIVLDVGADNSDLVFYQGECVSIAALDVSGNDITQAFVKKFRVSVAEAERLKREVGDSRQQDRILKVIEGTLNDLVGQVQRRVGFYKSQRPDAKLENLIISGNTFRMPGLPEFLAERLRYTINILEDLDRIRVAPGLPKDNFMQDLQGLGVALGLGLQATGIAKARVNLMPGAAQIQQLMAGKRWAAVVLIVLLVIGLIATWSIRSSRVADNAKLIAEIDGATKAAFHSPEVKDVQEKLQTVTEKANQLRRFERAGHHQGVTTGVADAVIGLVQRTVQRHGPQPDPEPDAAKRSDGLPSMFLTSLKLEDQAVAEDVFRPFLRVRRLTLTVDVLGGTMAVPRLRELLADLRALPMPESLALAHPAGPAWRASADAARLRGAKAPTPPPLFASVEQTQEAPLGTIRSYTYEDPVNVGPTGDLQPLSLPRTQSGVRAVFICTLPVEASP